MELTRSQKFIRDNKRVLGCGMDYYNPDTSYMPFEDWDKKRLHFLLIFPTPSAVKAVSSTAAAILDYTITHCPDVYIDFAYVPDATDMKLYDKNDMPYAIGLNSHLDASHFELVGFSISVLCEVIGMATIMNSFSRCDKPIPLTWTERKDAILGTYPVIYCGGITAACGDIMYGPLGDGRQAFPDFTYLGDCCKLSVISNRFLQAIDNGEVIRTKEDREYSGSKHYPAKFEATLTEKFKVITHQDFINCLLDMMWIYHPQGYEVKFNDKTQIISNKKINKYCQPYVTPCYPHVMEEDLGIGRTIIPASGDNVGVSQTQVSEGCSASGACSFCSEGNYCLPKGSLIKTTKGLMPIEEIKVGDKVVVECTSYKVCDTVVSGVKPAQTFVLSNGQHLKVATTHLMFTKEGDWCFKRAYELKIGDYLYFDGFLKEDIVVNSIEEAIILGGVPILEGGKIIAKATGFRTPLQIVDIIQNDPEMMYDINVEESHMYSVMGILSHNTGGWVEKTKCQILKEIWESKKYSAAWKYKPFSFNSNYLTDYKGMLAEFLKVYPKVTFLNMRMEELGRDLDAIKMMKLVGNNRMSAPMEGISPRIQNNMLNKCLSEVSLYNFMDDMVHMRLTDIKVGAIFTAYEEDEDFQWICDFVDKFKARAAEENGNFPFRLKATPLVHYNLTPCEYLERKSAKKSMLGEHWLTDEWYEKFREHNVFFKVNGFRYSTFIEQSLIDLGRLATPLVFKEIIQNNIGVYSLRSVATDGFVQGLKDLINPDYFFNDRDPEHYISLSHRIHIELLGSYVPRARRLVRLHQQGKLFENEPDIRCLKTYEGAKTKCQKFCIKKDPLKIYDDVEMDEEGNLHGEYEELYGCQRCNSNEERAGRLNRKIVCTKNSDDIIAVKRKPKVQKLRFVLKRNPEFEVLNPNNTAYTFITKFLQLSDNLLHEYHSMNVHSMFWESDPDEKYQVSGLQIVEVIWSNYVYDEVVSLIPEVNKMLKSTQVLSVKRIMMEEKIKLTDYNVCRFESSLPYEMFQNAIHSYKGEIKVKKDIAFEVVQDPTLKKPVIQQLGKVVGYFICPARYSPFYYLQGFLGVKKVSETKLAQSTDIQCMMVVRESKNTVCKNCGKESGTISLTTDKNFPFGVNCLTKALMSAEVKRMKEKN